MGSAFHPPAFLLHAAAMHPARLIAPLLALAMPVMVHAQDAVLEAEEQEEESSAPEDNRAGVPIPIGEPGEWILPEDYPAEALRDELQGPVGVALVVGPNGVPTSCTVGITSGSAILDDAACDLLMVRARFLPTRDASGTAVESRWSTKVRWELPPREPIPAAGRLLARIVVEKDGSISSCETELAEGMAAGVGSVCEENARFLPPRNGTGEAVRTRVHILFDIAHEELPD